MRTPASLVLLATLSACAGPRLYQDPADDLGAYARITIRNASPLALSARLFDDSVTCAGLVKLYENNAAVAPGEGKAVYAKKGAPFTIGAFYMRALGNGVRQCAVNTTVVPTAASYQVVYDADVEAKRCGVAVAEGEGRSSLALPRERFVIRKASQPFLQDGPWCKPLSAEQRAILGLPEAAAAR